MKRFKNRDLVAGLAVAVVLCAGAAERAHAQFTLTGTAAELVARGINANFETPVLARGDGEATAGNNLGPGWTFNMISGVSSDRGVQDPANGFYNTTAEGPLPAPFEGSQLGYINLNNPMSQAEIISNPIGRLRAGQTYTLNVAVGARNTTAWSDIAYRVGLRASDGTDLGTFATVTLDPGSGPTVIQDLQYTLTTSSVPAYVGDAVRIVIGGFNTGMVDGALTNNFSQANFDNARLAGTFDDLLTPPSASLTINRQTGGMTLNNTGAGPISVLGYNLTSAAGSFDQSSWSLIGGSFTKLTAAGSATDLSEMDFQGSGTVLNTTAARSLGNAWLRTPTQDVQGQLLLSDGSTLPLTVQYTGSAIPFGDLNGDGNITVADWTLFKSFVGTNFTGLSTSQAYLKGDLTGDKRHDLGDFLAFRNAFDMANGSGSFEAMLAAVPEPGAGLLLALGALLTLPCLRQRTHSPGVSSTKHMTDLMVIAFVAASVSATTGKPAAAQEITGVAYWSFDSLTIENGNIIEVVEHTGNHSATPGFGGTGGGTGVQHVSQPFPVATSSVLGQFGNALRFSGNNFLLFDNLTELMEGSDPANAPSYTISMWFKTETAGGAVPSPYATLGNWGNQPASAGPTRFTYGFGPTSATQMRGQTRRTNPSSGNGGTDGTDIFAASITTPALNDGAWHMLSWTFNTDTGQLLSYHNGNLVGTTQAAATAAPDYAMANSSSAVGGLGIKADSGTFIPAGSMLDEVYVFKGILSAEQIDSLYTLNAPPPGSFPDPINLTLRVNTTTGAVELRNAGENDAAISAYRVTSASGSLNPSGWDPISTGTPIPGFPQGNGTGNGWETSSGGGSNPADYNGDGLVDAADYVVWRKNNISGQTGYNTWRANFGASGGGVGGDDNELVEWYLTGESTLAAGAAINLGQMFTVGGTQDVVFQFATATGVRTGQVEYVPTFGGGAGSAAVPEPSTSRLLIACFGLLLAGSWRRMAPLAAARVAAGIALAIGLMLAGSTEAAVTVDRLYLFGDNSSGGNTENGAHGIAVGSGVGNIAPGATIDHVGPSGSFQDLLAASNGGGALPVYQNVSTLARPGAAPGSLGILFDGVDDYLNGFSLGFPPLSRGTHRGGGTGTLNYDGVYQRGLQLWAYPHSGATATQHMVADTTQHGVRINAAGNWALVHAGAEINSGVPVNFNQWSHVMAAIPVIAQQPRAVLYINGVAVAAHQAVYSTDATVNAQALIVGANSHADGGMVGTTNHFRGVLDDLQMFIWGKGYDPTTGAFTDFGTFNFATDNGYAASFLTGVFGDINNSGSVTQADVDAFVAGWQNEKVVNGFRVGDLTTFAKGDLNFDGITDLRDARLLRQALGGGGSAFDLSGFAAVTGLAVPEPSSLSLLGMLTALVFIVRRRKGAFVR